MTDADQNQSNIKKLVLDTGLRLVKEGMVSRTWGNVSARAGSRHFAVTPSGIPYEQLTETDIVIVSLDDLSYTGTVKPSSEKGLHAAVYQNRPDIQAVIHTHQLVASSFSAARIDINGLTGADAGLIGPHVKAAPYALPGTKKLANAVADALKKSNAALLANHGAVCIGKDMDTAFKVSLALEDLCQLLIEKAVMKKAQSRTWKPQLIHQYYLEQHKKG